jgi:hypothetical protein
MPEPSSPGNPPSKLPEKLNQRLNMYARAASAAGVSLMALAQPGEAKIVYTKTHQRVGVNGTYALDLNHDGVVDFLIQEWPGAHVDSLFNEVFAMEALGNAVQGTQSRFAAALRLGQPIGPGQRFLSGGLYGEGMAIFRGPVSSSKTRIYGPWANVNNHYLGLKFQIHGKTHYGWARLSVSVPKKGSTIIATLTGYAYETIPGKGLRAGETAYNSEFEPRMHPAETYVTNPESSASHSSFGSLNSGVLGNLALGASGLAFWRMR